MALERNLDFDLKTKVPDNNLENMAGGDKVILLNNSKTVEVEKVNTYSAGSD